ncbi:hypothetical protein MAPG_00674 [Magnaporthiopsis poae ATCC 64411]|uniref:Uncharacterized protein n=1 Tax=Magnaporthiopsis poae (strain ATCC 64411 / 73-15) TaxID=644358 RepID=A0A0C4DLN0_MAGP6|nr:hypothetical protein MAPG_00674 [Magnaporthiopsis poae ATCC 64411]
MPCQSTQWTTPAGLGETGLSARLPKEEIGENNSVPVCTLVSGTKRCYSTFLSCTNHTHTRTTVTHARERSQVECRQTPPPSKVVRGNTRTVCCTYQANNRNIRNSRAWCERPVPKATGMQICTEVTRQVLHTRTHSRRPDETFRRLCKVTTNTPAQKEDTSPSAPGGLALLFSHPPTHLPVSPPFWPCCSHIFFYRSKRR